MTRVHDMGGRHGDGAVIPEPQGMVPVGVDWQRSALALTLAAGGLGAWSIDTSRHAREKLSPKDYARFSYYEKWIAALADLLAEAGLVTKAELSAGEAASAAPHPKLFTADKVAPALARGTPYARTSDIAPAFAPGDRVRFTAGHRGVVIGHGLALELSCEAANRCLGDDGFVFARCAIGR